MFIEPKPVYKSSIHAIISQQRQTRSCMTSPLIQLDGDVKSKSVLFSSSDDSCGCGDDINDAKLELMQIFSSGETTPKSPLGNDDEPIDRVNNPLSANFRVSSSSSHKLSRRRSI